MSTRTSDFSHAPLQKEMIISFAIFCGLVLVSHVWTDGWADACAQWSGWLKKLLHDCKKKELACVFLITGLIKSQKGC